MRTLKINGHKIQIRKVENVVDCFQASLYVDRTTVLHYGNTEIQALNKVLEFMKEMNILYIQDYLDFTLGGNPDLKDF